MELRAADVSGESCRVVVLTVRCQRRTESRPMSLTLPLPNPGGESCVTATLPQLVRRSRAINTHHERVERAGLNGAVISEKLAVWCDGQ